MRNSEASALFFTQQLKCCMCSNNHKKINNNRNCLSISFHVVIRLLVVVFELPDKVISFRYLYGDL